MKSHIASNSAPTRRTGFTLVEMLVATALVVLIMFMFAQVFGMATQAMSQQKSMAELDQAARTITTVMANDMHARTFRDVMPFWPGQNTEVGTEARYEKDRRRGYFYISENDPASGTDDVLQLTIDVGNRAITGTPFARGDNDPRRDPNRRDPVLYGKTVQLREPPGDTDPAVNNISQPEFDDGNLPAYGGSADFSGMSQYAEVSYFLRNGNLYRRALLIRDRYDDTWSAGVQGLNGTYDAGDTINGDGHFWRDFDYSAWFDGTSTVQQPVFNTDAQLENSSAQPVSVAGFPLSLGVPHFRFGHAVFRNDGSVSPTGLPREFRTYSNTTSPADWPVGDAEEFIGRFTLHECSHEDFGYPGHLAGGSNPMDPATALNWDASGRYLIDEYDDQAFRRGDDLLMSNVHEFDIEVWDDAASPPRFLDLGHGNSGHYGSPDMTAGYGNRLDTWHPHSTALARPPYFPSGVPGAGTLPLGGSHERPLRGIQIRIRYLDVSTGSMRQVTRQFSLVDPGR